MGSGVVFPKQRCGPPFEGEIPSFNFASISGRVWFCGPDVATGVSPAEVGKPAFGSFDNLSADGSEQQR